MNSTLSARIEELQAQISTLYVENLRLRASEIALTSQLKKEREKSRKILADTESAVSTPFIGCVLLYWTPAHVLCQMSSPIAFDWTPPCVLDGHVDAECL